MPLEEVFSSKASGPQGRTRTDATGSPLSAAVRQFHRSDSSDRQDRRRRRRHGPVACRPQICPTRRGAVSEGKTNQPLTALPAYFFRSPKLQCRRRFGSAANWTFGRVEPKAFKKWRGLELTFGSERNKVRFRNQESAIQKSTFRDSATKKTTIQQPNSQ